MAHGAGRLERDLEDEYYIAVLGMEGVGKHTFLHVFTEVDASMETSDDESDDLDHVTLRIATHLGSTSVHLYACNRGGELTATDRADWDTLKGLPIAGALLFFDVCSRISYKVLPECYRDVYATFPDIPVAIVANKVEMKDRKVKPKMVTFHRKKNRKLFNMSVRAQYQVFEPVAHLLSELLGVPPSDLLTKEQFPPLGEVKIEDLEALDAAQRAGMLDENELPMPFEDDDDL